MQWVELHSLSKGDYNGRLGKVIDYLPSQSVCRDSSLLQSTYTMSDQNACSRTHKPRAQYGHKHTSTNLFLCTKYSTCPSILTKRMLCTSHLPDRFKVVLAPEENSDNEGEGVAADVRILLTHLLCVCLLVDTLNLDT